LLHEIHIEHVAAVIFGKKIALDKPPAAREASTPMNTARLSPVDTDFSVSMRRI
jgi:hypothetical protein